MRYSCDVVKSCLTNAAIFVKLKQARNVRQVFVKNSLVLICTGDLNTVDLLKRGGLKDEEMNMMLQHCQC